MNYSSGKSRESLVEAEIYYWLPLCFSQLEKAYNIPLTDATIERCILMVASALTLHQYNANINYEIHAVAVFINNKRRIQNSVGFLRWSILSKQLTGKSCKLFLQNTPY